MLDIDQQRPLEGQMKAFLSAIVVAVIMAGGASYYLTNFVDQPAISAYTTSGARL
jgi:hypothetical protein